MGVLTPECFRNFVFLGHGGCGKTRLVDQILHETGAVIRKEGSSSSDFEKEEKEHGHSIYPKFFHVNVADKRLNFIDTPGAADLIGQSISVLPAIDTAVIVVSAVSGVEVVTRKMNEAARERKMPRAILVNKIDSDGADALGVLAAIQAQLGEECVAVNLPADDGKKVVDCLATKAGDSDLGSVGKYHSAVMDRIVEMDEALMETYLAGKEPEMSDLHKPMIRAVVDGHVVPVLFCSATTGVGVKEFLAFVAGQFPSPVEMPPVVMTLGTGDSPKTVACVADATKPLIGHVVKVTTDPFIGKLVIFRVHQGSALGAAQVFVGHSKKGAKLAHVFNLQGKDHKEVPAIVAGDVGAVAKIEEFKVNDVFHNDHHLDDIHVKPIQVPTPMYGLAISPKARGDEQKLSGALHKIQEEDPTFRVVVDRQTHEMVAYGLGDLHLRIVLERLKHRGLDVDTKPPKIAYRETISAKAEGHHRHRKQTGGSGQFGEVYLRIEPLERGKGFEFADEIFGGTIPGQFMPAVEKGVREVLEQGAVAGYPMQDIRCSVYDGKHHPVDSKEVAFKAAGRMAFKDAIAKARPVLLEPVVNMEITVPEDKMGAIAGDLSGKRGRIQGTDVLPGGMSVIRAQAPLAEVMQYQSQLKSVTGGQGSFSMELSHYEPVPPQVQQTIISQYKPRAEEDEA